LKASIVSYTSLYSLYPSLLFKELTHEIATILKEKATSAGSLVSALNETATNIFEHVPAGVSVAESVSEVDISLAEINREYNQTASVVNNATLRVVDDIKITLINTLMESLGIEAPEAKIKEAKTAEQKLKYLLAVFDLVYIYFTVAVSKPLPYFHLSI
jgi:hypothetical protein